MGELVQIRFQLRVGQRSIDASVPIPAEPLRPAEILPAFLALGEAYMAMIREQVDEAGAPVSCRAGCGICCRQMVPVSETEAFYLAGLMASLPEPDRARILERFQRAIARLAAAGMLETLRNLEPKPANLQQLVMDYWALQIDCPFLENGSCGIYPHRPMKCREYLVTSPAVNCATPSPRTIRMVQLPAKLSDILFRFSDGKGAAPRHWMPLLLALEWAQNQDEESVPAIPGPELFRNFLVQIAELPADKVVDQ